jgi:hypothetical protein
MMIVPAGLVLIGLAAGVALARHRGTDGFSRLAAVLLPIVLAGTALAAWSAFRLLPSWSWSAARLASAVRLARGMDLYAPVGGTAVNDWIYGPVGALAYTPAALASSPLPALQIAAALNAFYFVLPAVVVLFLTLRDPAARLWGSLGLAFIIAALLGPFGTWSGAAVLHVDVVAVALGILSCVALVRHGNLPLAAAFAVLSVWTKQIDVALLPAQLGWLALVHGRRQTLAYAGWLGGIGLIVSAAFVAWFGFETLWHDLFVIPGRQAIEWERLGQVLFDFVLAGGWTAPVAWLAWKRRHELPDTERQLGGLLLTAAVVLLPLGTLSALKYGSGANSLHSIPYAIPGAALLLVWLVVAAIGRPRSLAAAGLMAGAIAVLAIVLPRAIRLGHLTRPDPGRQHEEAYEFAREHPGRTFFPWNPLATLMAEGRNDPFEYGYVDWKLASSAPTLAALRASLPAEVSFFIYHERDQQPFELLKAYPEFTTLRRAGGWLMFTRPGPTAP